MVIGSPRSGLSSIYHALAQHPQLQVIASADEAYFSNDQNFLRGTPRKSIYESAYKEVHEDLIRGEISSSYFTHPFAISRIQRYNPDVKLVIVLRNPAIRTYSHWQHAKSRGIEQRSFDEVVQSDKSSSDVLHFSSISPTDYMAHSLYSEYVSHIQQYFGPHQLLYVRTEDLKEDTEVALYRISDFIGVPYFDLDIPAQNVQSYDQSLSAHLYEHLQEVHREDVCKLEALTGCDCSDWTSSQQENKSAYIHNNIIEKA